MNIHIGMNSACSKKASGNDLEIVSVLARSQDLQDRVPDKTIRKQSYKRDITFMQPRYS